MLRSLSLSRLLSLSLVLICLFSLATPSHAADPSELSPEDLAAEEAAAAAVGEAAEEEDDEEADALDEDADAARLNPDKHPLTDIPPPSDDVLIAHTFTDGFETPETLTLGEKVQALIAFANEGRGKYHVWGVTGSLNMEKQFRIHVQNFSYTTVNQSVAPGTELSFAYEFVPNERLDIRPFQLALTVFYEMQSSGGNAIRGHATTFYNQTVATEPSKGSMSNGMFMALFTAFLAAIVGAVILWKNTEQKKETVEVGNVQTSKNEWLEDHHNMMKSGGGRKKVQAAGKR